MKLTKSTALLAISTVALASCGSDSAGGGTRDSIMAVGSSTVFPFAKSVAETFVRANANFESPRIESTGTGGGMKLFCAGTGADTPDISNASRRMKASEFADCQANGVTDVIEIQVGMDGIAFASAQGGINMNLSPEIVYQAIAAKPYGKEQTAKNWSDVDASLPNKPILVYGPPATSGTRDALKELVLEVGCKSNEAMKALKESDEDSYDQICTEVRDDGGYVDQGEQDNLIVQKIQGNSDAVGVFGYSYLEENADKVQGLSMNGVAPTYEKISSFEYPGARPLYIYVKKAHIGAIPGLEEFLGTWVENWKADGSLSKIGLIPSPEDVMAKSTAAATEYTTLTAADLEK